MAMEFAIDSVASVMVEGITGPSGADRMYITSGEGRTWMQTQSVNYVGLIEPVLQPGQFRRAIASVSLMSTDTQAMSAALFGVSEVDADWDDESGKVELRFTAGGGFRLSFQVMVFAVAPSP